MGFNFENGGGGSLYNLDTFFARIFDDIEWEDMPLPVTNQQMMDHFQRSVLNVFSQFYPRQEVIRFGEEARVPMDANNSAYRRYRLPMYRFPTSICLGVSSVEPLSNIGYPDSYGMVPFLGSPDTLLMAMADIRMLASMGAASSHSLTSRFTKPDVLDLYGGYSSCSYEAILLLSHDMSLSTIPDTAFEAFYELALLDTKAYFYSKLKRKDGLDTGVGNIQLKIDDWSNAAQERKELLNTWKQEGYNLNIDEIHFFN